MSVLANSNVIGSGTSGGIDTGDIEHSLRFRGAQYLNRTPGGAGSRRILTYSAFLKVSPSAAMQRIFVGNDTGSSVFNIAINASNQLEIVDFGGAYQIRGISTRLFRDPTVHIHLVVALDTNQATFANAVKVWVNNEQITSWGTSTYSGAHDMQMNDTRMQGIGVYLSGGVPTSTFDYYGGYLSRACLVDGTALTPSSFGYLNTEINEWVSKSQSQVKAVVDAGGTNSFMLDFDDATSLTTLGYDKSSKGNNWTLNNFSLTAGSTYDHMLDVPGNSYATLNPLDTAAQGSSITHSAGNLQIAYGTSAWRATPSSIVMISGKWYAEADVTQGGAGTALLFGASTVSTLNSSSNLGNWAGSIGIGKGTAGAIFAVEGSYPAAPHSIAANDRNLVAIDCDAGKAWLGYYDASVPSTTWYSSAAAATGNPVTGANPTMTFTPGTPIEFVHGIYATGTAYAAYFGASGFAATQPTGFKALCQANLPDVAIKNPKLHFDVLTHTGNGVQDRAITGSQFDPDFAWIKNRGVSATHVLFDRVRGGDKQLFSNLTNAEQTNNDITNGFATGGIIVGDNVTGTGSTNQNTNTYVDWLWKAGGAAVSNTAGSITSQVSANVDAGFSIVTATLSAANGTVGHGQGKAPKLIIGFKRNGVSSHPIYHSGLTSAANVMYLDTTAAQAASATTWNSTPPTSTVFSVGTGLTGDWVFYCFADIEGYSKAFSYTGNASTDGVYVDLGFKPRWLLIKRTDSTGDWLMFDTTRNTFNVMNLYLGANLSSAEFSDGALDTTANGMKWRTTGASANASGGTYIGFAIADVAGKYSLAR